MTPAWSQRHCVFVCGQSKCALIDIFLLPLFTTFQLLLNTEAVTHIVFQDVGNILNRLAANIPGCEYLHVIEPDIGIIALLLRFST